MLKFFRKYNKYILAVGCVVLMIAFLVPQFAQMYAPNPMNRVVGQVYGQDVTEGDLTQAANELELLDRLFRGVSIINLVPYEREQWLLMQREAERMGLAASSAEVNTVLARLGLDEQGQVDELSRNMGLTEASLRSIVGKWLVSERYRLLVTGRRLPQTAALTASPGLVTLSYAQELADQLRSLQSRPEQEQQFYFQVLASQFLSETAGVGRISASARERFGHELLTVLDGQVLLIPAKADEAATADPATVQRLFEEYKDVLPGQGDPYPFGYQYPDRVKLEWVRIPRAAIEGAVKVDAVEVLDEYRKNPSRYVAEGEPPARPTDEVRQRIAEELKRQKADALMQSAVSRLRGVLEDQARGTPEVNGYRTLPEDFEPMPLTEATGAVADELGVTLETGGEAEAWVPVSELSSLPGVGMSAVSGSSVFFPTVVMQARELLAEVATPALRLQVGLPGPAMVSMEDGSVYVFRLLDAQRSHPPQSLDEVRAQVEQDARRLAAYEALREDAEAYKARAAEAGLSPLTSELGATLTQTGEFPRRELRREGMVPPQVPGVGQSESFIDAAFALAEGLKPGDDVKAMPIEQRLAVVPIDGELALAVFELQGYQPPSRGDVRNREAQLRLAIDRLMAGEAMDEALSPEALAQRAGYTLEAESNRDEETAM